MRFTAALLAWLVLLGAVSATATAQPPTITVRASAGQVVLTKSLLIAITGQIGQPLVGAHMSVFAVPGSRTCPQGEDYEVGLELYRDGATNLLEWDFNRTDPGSFSEQVEATPRVPGPYTVCAYIWTYDEVNGNQRASASTAFTVARPQAAFTSVSGQLTPRGRTAHLRVQVTGTTQIPAHLVATASTGGARARCESRTSRGIALAPQRPLSALGYFPQGGGDATPPAASQSKITMVGPGRFTATFLADDTVSPQWFGRQSYRLCVWLGWLGLPPGVEGGVRTFNLAGWTKVVSFVRKPPKPAVLSIKHRDGHVRVQLRGCRNDRYNVTANYIAATREFMAAIIRYDGVGSLLGRFDRRFRVATGSVKMPRCSFHFRLRGRFR